MISIGEIQDALERQVPMKPLLNDDCAFYTCMNCDGEISYSGNYKDHKYCLLCGQKLVWGKE